MSEASYWYVRVVCEAGSRTDHRRHRFNRRIPNLVPAKPWIEEHLPPVFYGHKVHILTPIHHDVGVIDPETRKFTYTI